MNWVKVLNFIDGVFEDNDLKPEYGKLYKIEGESLPFRFIYSKGDEVRGVHRFKHHQLKEYTFYDFKKVEREANLEEVRVYNLIKNHVDNIVEKNN